MKPLEERDYFTDYEILKDPYAYFEAIRAKGPVYAVPGRDFIIVTGFEEILEVLKNHDAFSAVIDVQGAAAPLPFEPKGSDITADIEAHRSKFLGGDLVVAYDDQQHTYSRSLLSGLFTPSRLKANEEFIADYSDELVRDAAARGGCELIKEIATPFVTMVIADLLGVPEGDRKIFMDAIEAGPPPGSLDTSQNTDFNSPTHPLVVMGGYFAGYVMDRRQNPRDDVLSHLSNAKYPDGSTPDALEIVRLATFLFGAGQDTSAKLLGNTMRFIVDEPGLQQKLRQDQSLIPALLEEVLRLEGSTKQTARLARKDSKIGDMRVPAGTKVMLALSAGNRDPRRWEDPDALILKRHKVIEHIGFGRGKHVCVGAPLARVEVRIILEKFLQYTFNIDLDGEKHGPRGDRRLDYDPSFIIRGLSHLHLKLQPAAGLSLSPSARSRFKAAAEAPSPVGYSTASAQIGRLLADPAAKALVDRHFPGLSADSRIGMAKGMTLRAVQSFAPDRFTSAALDALDADLAKLPAA